MKAGEQQKIPPSPSGEYALLESETTAQHKGME
jgi:hypothetical protein